MKDIGNLLKKKRLLLDWSLEKASKETKITVDKLEAIEEGNLAFFVDDFSYLKFYVRYYFNYLNLDFEEYKDVFYSEIDAFQHTQTVLTVEKSKQLNENLKKRIESTTSTITKEHRKLDYSMISLIVVLIFLVGVVGFVAINYGQDIFGSDKPSLSVTPTTTATPTPDVTTTPDAAQSQLYVEKEAFNRYLLKGYSENEEVKIDVHFNHETWTRFLINDVVSNNPVSTTYKPDEKIQLIINAVDETKVTIHLGYYQGNEIYINGKRLELDETVANLTNGQQIDLVFKGE